MLADAIQHPQFGADRYVAAHGVRSALALPILHQSQRIGVLYLENNLATRVFAPERVRLLQLLSSQIATSLQNSQLFERLTTEVEERKRVERALAEELARSAAIAEENARLYREAQQSIQTRDDFLSIASHELKTPLASLRLVIDGFTGGSFAEAPEAAASAAAILSRQTQRLELLVGDLLDVAGIRGGRLSVQLGPVDVSAVVRDLAERFAPQLARARSPLAIEAPSSLWAMADRGRLDQLLGNLLSNAIKFGAGHPVAIEARPQPGLVAVTVVDHGIGIPRERLAHIFGRFERAASHDYGGLGLGLYIAHHLATAMSGRLSVESTVGVGSRFTVELPASSAAGLAPISRARM